ncbi:hypothetical protein RSOLAG22IIIB_09149 [Rhizoctonia solani]|uniref:Uncharacterized protein n=1 Tax=Rhizoctonia solani TaxID=456999 RepID=A0A0K6FX09_9AGAM|nr:hypothetical protein RSOLAG22IIIB_09149 [Rhizoctonia solani]
MRIMRMSSIPSCRDYGHVILYLYLPWTVPPRQHCTIICMVYELSFGYMFRSFNVYHTGTNIFMQYCIPSKQGVSSLFNTLLSVFLCTMYRHIYARTVMPIVRQCNLLHIPILYAMAMALWQQPYILSSTNLRLVSSSHMQMDM